LRFLFHLILLIGIAIGVGFGLSYYALTDGRFFATFSFGPWVAWPAAGSPAPDPYTRAYLARRGALQMGRTEGIEFTAETDSDGRTLTIDCTYRIDGRTPVAAFWTLVATDEEGRNLARPNALLYLDSGHIAREPDGSFVLRVGRRLASGNWLEIDGDGPFHLVLRLYDAAVFTGLGNDVEELPVIIREACA